MSQANIDKLERVQNILARVVVGAPRRTSSSLNIRRDLHWLPVGHRIVGVQILFVGNFSVLPPWPIILLWSRAC